MTTLITFICTRGGVADYAGDLAAIGATRLPGLVRRSGRPLDAVREAAVEAGYLPGGADINDLIDLIGEAVRGRRVVALPDQAGDLDDRTGRSVRAANERLRGLVLAFVAELGVPGGLSAGEVDDAARLVASGLTVEDAVSHVIEREIVHSDELEKPARVVDPTPVDASADVKPGWRVALAQIASFWRAKMTYKYYSNTWSIVTARGGEQRKYVGDVRDETVLAWLASKGLSSADVVVYGLHKMQAVTIAPQRTISASGRTPF
jgi:hypothetical protein